MTNQNIDIPDFHSHNLPCVDHGSDSVAVSLFQLDLAKKQGVNRVVSTPHFYPHQHTVSNFLEIRNRAYSELCATMSENLPEIKLGAEVLLCSGIDKLEGLRSLCLNGSEYILIELPFFDFRDEYVSTVKRLLKSDYKVILAHADRYHYKNIERLLDAGVDMIQLNASSLCRVFKNKTLYRWIESGLVVALGSDIHGKDVKAYKNFKKASNKLGDWIADIKLKSDEIWNKISALN